MLLFKYSCTEKSQDLGEKHWYTTWWATVHCLLHLGQLVTVHRSRVNTLLKRVMTQQIWCNLIHLFHTTHIRISRVKSTLDSTFEHPCKCCSGPSADLACRFCRRRQFPLMSTVHCLCRRASRGHVQQCYSCSSMTELGEEAILKLAVDTCRCACKTGGSWSLLQC